MRKIFAIMGKASTGKDSLTTMISEQLEMEVATSFTTRPKRAGEKDGVEYYFLDDASFWDLHGCDLLAEYTSYNVAGGDIWYYGLTKEELEQGDYVLVIVNPHGLEQLKAIYGDKVCSILIDADAKIRIERYLNRDVITERIAEECCRRFLADNKDFKNISTDYVVYNNEDLKSSYKALERIVRNERAKDLLNKVNEEFQDNPKRFINA